jgi:hypothetical protein
MSYKAIELSAELADELRKRTTLLVTESADTDGNPVITVSADSTPAAGEKVIVVRTAPITWGLAKDVLGLASTVYTPHVIQVCTEANYEGTTDSVLDILGPAELLPVLITVGKRGTRVEWYQTTNGTVPSVAAMISTNLKASHEADVYHGMLSSQ